MFARNPALEARLVEDPDDALGYEVYGDWLCAQGSPHGELMQIQRARQLEPRNPVWQAREGELLDQLAAALVGEGLAWRARQLAWDTGYVRGVRAPLAHLAELLARPAGLLVRDVEVNVPGSLQAGIAQLAAAPPVVTSALLYLEPRYNEAGAPDDEPNGRSRGAPASAASLCRAQPRLVRLGLLGGPLALDGMAAPALRELIVAPRDLTRVHLRALAGASLPALEQLELQFSYEPDTAQTLRYRSRPDAASRDDLYAVLASLPPSLCELRIADAAPGDLLCELLCELGLARRLRRLVLTRCDVSNRGAAALRAHRDRFEQLEQLELTRHRITNRAILEGFPGWSTRAPDDEFDE